VLVSLDPTLVIFIVTLMIRFAHTFVTADRRNNAGEPLPCAQQAVP
jgi:hypothetical protein